MVCHRSRSYSHTREGALEQGGVHLFNPVLGSENSEYPFSKDYLASRAKLFNPKETNPHIVHV